MKKGQARWYVRPAEKLKATSHCGYLILVLLLCSCTQPESFQQGEQLTGGSAFNGRHLIYSYGCGSCHIIPGIAEANGTVGPTLKGFASRVYIAGSLTNETKNLLYWIAKPQEIVPGNAMPNLGITEHQARDMAAYLYTLQ